jgi:hypothetical protein
MVAVSFGSYASDAVPWGSSAWIKVFAVLIVAVMTMLNVLGSQAVARVQTVVVTVVIGILAVLAVVTLVNMDPHLLAFSGYPSVRDIVSSVALTFFAFLGFGIVSFTAKDLAKADGEHGGEQQSGGKATTEAAPDHGWDGRTEASCSHSPDAGYRPPFVAPEVANRAVTLINQ